MKKKSLLLSIVFLLSLSSNVSAATVDRLGGQDRYETAAKINNQMQSDTLIVVSGNDFADALSSTSLVKYYNAEIHLVNKELDSNTVKSLNNNEFKKAVIVGGTGVISPEIENNIKTKLGNDNVERLGGKNRYETSEIVAAKVLELAKSDSTYFNGKVFIVTGKDFADALSVAPIAAKLGHPIILTPGDSIGTLGLNTIKSIGNYYKVGGEAVVSDKIDSLTNLGKSNIKRLSGKNRYETNKAVIGEFTSNTFDFKNVYVASGLDFPDALAGSVLAAKNNAPIVFVSKSDTTSAKNVVSTFNCESLIALGGTGVVSNENILNLTNIKQDKEIVFEYKKDIVIPKKDEAPSIEDIGLVTFDKSGNDCNWTFAYTKGGANEDNGVLKGSIGFRVLIDGKYYYGETSYIME